MLLERYFADLERHLENKIKNRNSVLVNLFNSGIVVDLDRAVLLSLKLARLKPKRRKGVKRKK